MYPEIFNLSWLHTYGVLVAAAFLTALWLAGTTAALLIGGKLLVVG